MQYITRKGITALVWLKGLGITFMWTIASSPRTALSAKRYDTAEGAVTEPVPDDARLVPELGRLVGAVRNANGSDHAPLAGRTRQ